MKAQVKVQGGRILIDTGEVATQKALFEAIADIQEVFDGDLTCGNEQCLAPNPKFRVRERQGFTFYEMFCEVCGYELHFGQPKEGGGLWPKRKSDDDNSMLPNRGWIQRERKQDGTPDNAPRDDRARTTSSQSSRGPAQSMPASQRRDR